jgi:ubiquitin-protein ligase
LGCPDLGPDGTDWEGALLRAQLTIPTDYPNSPPKVQFTTPGVFHPNVDKVSGRVCIQILGPENSTPDYNIIAILTSVQALLVTPNPGSTLNSDAGRLWTTNRSEYRREVQKVVRASSQGV